MDHDGPQSRSLVRVEERAHFGQHLFVQCKRIRQGNVANYAQQHLLHVRNVLGRAVHAILVATDRVAAHNDPMFWVYFFRIKAVVCADFARLSSALWRQARRLGQTRLDFVQYVFAKAVEKAVLTRCGNVRQGARVARFRETRRPSSYHVALCRRVV